MRALFLGAHPDDVETNAGGTVAKLASEGWEVFICVVQGVADARYAEAETAAAILGAQMWNAPNITPRFWLQNFEGHDFDLIVTTSPTDSHQEHRAIAELGISLARKNNVELWHMNHAIPGGLANPPALNHYVILNSSDMQQKRIAVGAHKSQAEKYGWDWWWGTINARDSYLGGMVAFGDFVYAEGFERVISYG